MLRCSKEFFSVPTSFRKRILHFSRRILYFEITDALSETPTKPQDVLIRVTIRISRTELAKQPLSDPHNICRELAPLLVPLDHSSRSINFPCDADL